MRSGQVAPNRGNEQIYDAVMSDQPFLQGHQSTSAYHAPLPMTTAFEFPNWQTVEVLGPCFGLVVRSMGMGKSIGASFRAMAGGEVTQYTQLLEDSRRHALDRMVENAQLLGANAILGLRFDSSEMGQGLTEIVAYGTAVVVAAPPPSGPTAPPPPSA